MATEQRPSLQTDLASRYQNQKEGGAYDAKQAGTSTAPPSIQSKQFELTDKFVIKEPQGLSEFKNQGNGISLFVAGLDTRKYKG